jgi:dihydroxyacetone kinase-like protein
MSRGEPSVSGDLIAAMIEAARDGVAARGGAHVGDKTMLDALDGAARTSRSASVRREGASGTLTAAAEGAEAGAAATREMLATVGRASRLGARSVGHVDPGATSVAIILRAAADHLNGRRSS